MNIIFNQTVIMLIIILVGIICCKLDIISQESNKDLSKFVLNVVNPMVIFLSYQKDYKPELVKNLLLSFVISFVSFLIMILFSYILIKKKADRETEIERFASVYSNCGFMGIPLVNAVIGSIGVFYLTAYITCFNLFVWTHGVILLSGERDFKQVIKVFYSPVIISIILGLFCFFLQIKIPNIVAQGLDYIAVLNTPLAMIISGVTIANTNIFDILKKKRVYYISLIRLIVMPMILIAIMNLFSFPDEVRRTIVIAISAPVAANCTLQCIRLGKNSLYSSEIFALTTLSSVLTIPAMSQIDKIIQNSMS